jgi:hypothetical protein
MFLIKQVKNNFLVKGKGFRTIEYDNFQKAQELCRLRCHKLLHNDDLKIIKIPFFKIWLVW